MNLRPESWNTYTAPTNTNKNVVTFTLVQTVPMTWSFTRRAKSWLEGRRLHESFQHYKPPISENKTELNNTINRNVLGRILVLREREDKMRFEYYPKQG